MRAIRPRKRLSAHGRCGAFFMPPLLPLRGNALRAPAISACASIRLRKRRCGAFFLPPLLPLRGNALRASAISACASIRLRGSGCFAPCRGSMRLRGARSHANAAICDRSRAFFRLLGNSRLFDNQNAAQASCFRPVRRQFAVSITKKSPRKPHAFVRSCGNTPMRIVHVIVIPHPTSAQKVGNSCHTKNAIKMLENVER